MLGYWSTVRRDDANIAGLSAACLLAVEAIMIVRITAAERGSGPASATLYLPGRLTDDKATIIVIAISHAPCA